MHHTRAFKHVIEARTCSHRLHQSSLALELAALTHQLPMNRPRTSYGGGGGVGAVAHRTVRDVISMRVRQHVHLYSGPI